MTIRTESRPRLRGEFLLAIFLVAAMAAVLPGAAEAGVVVRAGIGPVTVVASSGGVWCGDTYPARRPGHRVMTAGCNDFCCRPAIPRHGRYVWVPGHYEKHLVRDKWERGYKQASRHGKAVYQKAGHGKYKKNKKYHKRDRRHSQKRYTRVWIPGHWERI